MGQPDPSDFAYLRRDLSNVFMPQPNPEHVLFIQKSLLLRAIFRLIPSLKKTFGNMVASIKKKLQHIQIC